MLYRARFVQKQSRHDKALPRPDNPSGHLKAGKRGASRETPSGRKWRELAPRTLTSHTVQAGFSAKSLVLTDFVPSFCGEPLKRTRNTMIRSTLRQVASHLFVPVPLSRHNSRNRGIVQDRVLYWRSAFAPVLHPILVSPNLLIAAIADSNYPPNHLAEPDPGL
jgi:hypothetical protein